MSLATALAVAVTACGGGSSNDTSDSAGQAVEAPASGAGSSAAGASESSDGSDGIPEVDVCKEIPAADVQAVITGADPITATPNDVVPVPNCDYTITIAGPTITMEPAIVSITYLGDRALFESTEPVRRGQYDDVSEVPELGQAIIYDQDGVLDLVVGDQAWSVLQGVEIDAATSRLVTGAELVAVGQLVEERLG
ncbi:MAG: hypothetical protein MUE36_08755 [Acidimicrobiales bacterium]|jgi:hypothetical protein|nr:hypothetical protein [Acidimicrobiales bacterium]